MRAKSVHVHVEGRGEGPTAMRLTYGGHTIVTDEPVGRGGTDRGPAPFDTMIAGLAGCTHATLRLVARDLGVVVEDVRVTVDADIDRPGSRRPRRPRSRYPRLRHGVFLLPGSCSPTRPTRTQRRECVISTSEHLDHRQVLIVGAGPVGLTAAIALTHRGVGVRVIERRPTPPESSRACVLWPRTLDVLAALGVDTTLGGRITPARRMRITAYGTELGDVVLDGGPGRHPHGVFCSQVDVEHALTARLAALGIEAERGVEALSVTPTGDRVAVRTLDAEGPRTLTADWVIGAEGSSSLARRGLDLPFTGARVPDFVSMQVDAHLDWGPGAAGDEAADHAAGVARFFLHPSGYLGALPMPDGDTRLFMGQRDTDPADWAAPTAQQLTARIAELTGHEVRLHDPRWPWRVRFSNRLTTTLRVGRVLLAGDAGRVFSPVMGQGMNTGIQDADNLAWKLTAVAAGTAAEALLNTYTAERLPIAALQVGRSTALLDRVMHPHPLQVDLARTAGAAALTSPALQAAIRGAFTEADIAYPTSPLTRTDTARREPGDPLRPGSYVPDLPLAGGGTVHTHRDARDWCLLSTTPEAPPTLPTLVLAQGLLPDEHAALVRPDGYLAWTGPRHQAVETLSAVLTNPTTSASAPSPAA